MPVLTGTVSVAANATSANLVTGELYEFLGEPSVVNLFVASAATGSSRAALRAGRNPNRSPVPKAHPNASTTGNSE